MQCDGNPTFDDTGEGELVREEIIEAALAEFAERGYHQTSITHIAARLGSGHSLFYRYFENKRDILQHVVEHAMARTLATLAEVSTGPIASIEEFRDFSERLGLSLTATFCEDPRISQLLLQSATVDDELVQQFNTIFDMGSAALADILRSGVEAGYVRPDVDIEATADSIVAIPLGLQARYGLQPDYEPLAARVRATVDLVSRGVEAR
ncbi:MAG: TetR/AcrR family transcriptional regulator [Segniliparus sp.]|uniref:TetR/AcrR family transcriptional regulator n=1 Tax=Segniliparus sp. TaxID=2804064 RepID=UPI003F32BCB2